MHGYIGGAVIAVGMAWIFAWLSYEWFTRTHIWSQGAGTAFKTRTSAENTALDVRGQRSYRRAADFLRRGAPVAVLISVAGIAIAVL